MANRCTGALLPPSLVTQVEDEDAEREDEEDAGDGEGDDGERASCKPEALEQEIMEVDG